VYLVNTTGRAAEFNRLGSAFYHMRKLIISISSFILLPALVVAWFRFASGDVAFFSAFLHSIKIILIVGAVLFVLFWPFMFLIRKWWKNKCVHLDLKNNQKAKAVDRFIRNGNALIGSITIFYALLLALFAHIIAPDITPYANDQINELPFKEPGYKIEVLYQPLELKPEATGFFDWLWNGKKVDYRQIPITSYQFAGDTLIVERYIGDGIAGQELHFLMEDITGEKVSAAENQAIITKKWIHQKQFILGTDDLGRDYLSRILLGIRVSLSVGVVAVIIALFIGIPLGALAGFYKRYPPFMQLSKKRKLFFPVDGAIMWFINIVWSIPTLLLVFPIVFAFGQNFYTIFIAVGITMWVDIARIVRGQVLQVREMEFIQAAKTFGFSDTRTIFRHILPNITGPVIVITAANFAYAILTEAGLSFLGIGVQPPAPSWGLMISKYKDNLVTEPYLALIPGFAITILVLAFFMIGNGLRDALDIKSRL
jgi:ABC-type dipeptide/oligopeptide/nickel transport system permease subunit